jgi:hypothetical protein
VKKILYTMFLVALVAFSASAQETKMRQAFCSGRSRFLAVRPRRAPRSAWETSGLFV